ncbi:MBL fold metallo-hydrolase [Natronoflexus pectinivorans]|uniref:Glyoxylase-like metal-dependent hydrolase (Beta-lactamase superfamily II) n=1 Tax=Natronoflexus pectinivorans TaxID=682526 RepID=A0A4R2GLX5_9BACT|nr:MBL fold metallo-hydrolase [Natronoflexus pectinivorans]TCO09698.1 glyoxylase-like metal-dependent hydrolase (beta-lactamase superfamily II) [Natronoflexus pectinivorans]
MIQVKNLVYNPFQENTYIVYDESKECVIFDPGMLSDQECQHFSDEIESLGVKPVKLLQTHLHLDHVFGTSYVSKTYELDPVSHKDDLFFLEQTQDYALQFGLEVKEKPPVPKEFLTEGDEVRFGNTVFKVIHIPGHSPGGILFYNEESKTLFSGDVLFQGSVGRSDLPGGNHESLIKGIQEKLMVLPDDVVVYSGHGPSTTIGKERYNNPFL